MRNLCFPRPANKKNWRLIAAVTTFFLLVLSTGVTVLMQSATGGSANLARKHSAPPKASSGVKVRRDVARSGSRTMIPLNLTPDATIVPPSGCPNVINDPTFEAGDPWTAWNIQTSDAFGTSMCDPGLCNTNGGVTGPYSGTNWLWFGGGIDDIENSTLGQTLTIPTGKAAFLHFQMNIQGVVTPFDDTVQVKVDGTSVQTFTEPSTPDLTYSERVVDLSAYANGMSHTVVFEYNSNDGNSNFLIDDIFLEVCNSSPAPKIPSTNAVTDSNFEAGDPWPAWGQSSTVFGTPMCDIAGCGQSDAAGPFSGENWAFMGGYGPSTAGTDTVSQSVNIPAGARAKLRFRLFIGQVTSPFTDTFKVKVDGNPVFAITEPSVADEVYRPYSINLNQFANGAAHTILFEYVGMGGGTSIFNLDDIYLDIEQGGQNFVASLTGAQEVPPNASAGTGVGLVTLNAAENQITVSLDYVGLGTAATLSHIHGSATSTPGNTAPVIFDFGAVNGTAGAFSGLTFAITPAQVALLRQGLLYFNVHTSTFPNGEIRGQIHPNDKPANFDGDGNTDVVVFRPSNSTWYVRSTDGGFNWPVWGLSTDVLVPGDYDGDTRADVAVFRNGTWYIRRSSDGGLVVQIWGFGSDIPVPNDYDKDGKTDIAVFRPSNGTWYILKSSNNQLQAQQWGISTDKPVPGDYDRDGKADVAVARPDDPVPGVVTWYISNSSDGSFTQRQFGINTDKLVPGDYTGDGKTDIAVWRPSEGKWYISTGPNNNDFIIQVWGLSTDVPVPGDYDSDAKTDVAVFRPSEGKWYILRSLNNTLQVVNWGASTDIPVPSIYVR